jgi:hypothetical protein
MTLFTNCILFTIPGPYVKQDMGIPVKILIIMFLLIFALSGCKDRGKNQEGTILWKKNRQI